MLIQPKSGELSGNAEALEIGVGSQVDIAAKCDVFLDADNKDQAAWHVMGWRDGELVASSRILPPAVTFREASIGRVVTARSVRRLGVGKELMRYSLGRLYELLGNVPVRIGGQLYLKKFYESFGFKQSGDVYLEDGIEHIEMLKD